MNGSPAPLLHAFQLLWDAAKSENGKYCPTSNVVNGNYEMPKLQTSRQKNSEPLSQGAYFNGTNHQPCFDADQHHKTINGAFYRESAVVCTLDCDHGSKFVRQIIHEGTQRSEWSRAEDLFVDWLNCELTSQHAQRVDVTIYFCHVPINTCTYGICLWLENLRAEGKEVNIKVKIASLGPEVIKYVDSMPVSEGQGSVTLQGSYELRAAEDTVVALRKLTKMDAKIELISTEDWVQLVSLLTDRVSLQAVDLKRSPTNSVLTKILRDTH